MASGTETFEEQFFTCSICTDVFQEPKVLPCQHSFCKNCIKPYIKSAVVNESNRTGFLCPYCRYFVKAENSTSPTEVWAESLPTNFNLVCMMEAFDTKEDTSTKRITKCLLHKKVQDFYCNSHGQNVCANCAITVHRSCSVVSMDDVDSDLESLAIFVSRRLTKINILLGRISTNILSIKQDRKALKQETAERFDKIKQEIDQMQTKFFGSVDLKCDAITKDLQIKYDQYKELQSQVQGLLEQLVAMKTKSIDEIIKGNRNIKEMINLFQTEISKIDYNEIHVQLDWADDADKFIENVGLLGAMTVNEKERQSQEDDFVSVPYGLKCKDSEENFKDPLLLSKSLALDNETEPINFSPSLSELIQPLETLNFNSLLGENMDSNITSGRAGNSGEFSASVTDYDSLIDEPGSPVSTYDQIIDIVPETSLSSPPMISSKFCAFSAGVETDSKDCLITGVDFLPDDKIILVDRNNRKLKLFSHDFNFLRLLNLEHVPFDIAVTGGLKIAVSFPEKETIELFDSELDGKTGSLSTQQTCYGLSTGSGRLFVVCRATFTRRNCIKVFDGYNNLSQVINLEHSSVGNRIVYSPLTCTLFYSSRNLLSATEVVCLYDVCNVESQPKIKFIKKIPRLGRCVLARLPNGIIAGSQKSNLYWISCDGQTTQEVLKLDQEGELCTVAVKNDGSKLIMSQTHNLFNSEDSNDIVCVYDITA